MKPKQTLPLFSLEDTQILKEILRYVRFFALNKERIEEQENQAIQREIKTIDKIFSVVSTCKEQKP